ncbi:MAG: PIN domain-containing protein [Acidimicrobiales bacterium]
MELHNLPTTTRDLTRGGAKATDAPVHRIIKAVGEIVPVLEQDGRLAGSLLGATGSKSTIDALIVATAIRLGCTVILTGDSRSRSILAAEQQVRIESF